MSISFSNYVSRDPSSFGITLLASYAVFITFVIGIFKILFQLTGKINLFMGALIQYQFIESRLQVKATLKQKHI